MQKKIQKKKHINFKEQLEIQSMMLPALILLFIFSFIPMYGIIIAFKEYGISSMSSGFLGGKFIGLKYFKEFFTDPLLKNTVVNTLIINLLGLIIAFPAPIILALFLNEIKNVRFKKVAQTISYLPHFLSWVIFGGIIMDMLSPGGIISSVSMALGSSDNLMAQGKYFYFIYTTSALIKSVGFGSILYVAAITGIDQELYEAATVDGCNRFQKMLYITIPCIAGTIVIMLIFQITAILNTGYEQIILFQNPLNIKWAETIDTYVYKIGISQSRFSYSTAVGLIKSILSIILLLFANFTSKKLVDRGLF